MSALKSRSGQETLTDTNIAATVTTAKHREVLKSLHRSVPFWGDAEVRVVNMSTTDPSGLSPSDLDKYVVNSGATGDWSGQDDNIAIWDASSSPGEWFFVTPEDGMAVWNVADDKQYRWDTGVSPAAWTEQASGGASSFSGFRAIQTSAQSVSTATVMALDSVSGSNDAFNEGVDIGDLLTDEFFTVPAGLNGSYADFTAGMETASDQGIFLLTIQRSTDSGSNWNVIAQTATGDGYFGRGNPRTGPIKLSSGDLWRVVVTSASTVNTTGDRRCFFSMTVLGS